MRHSPPLRGKLPVADGAECGVPVDPGHEGSAVADAGTCDV